MAFVMGAGCFQIAAAQTRWVSLKGPYTGDITLITVDRQGNCYAASQFTGVYRSTNGGTNWNAVNFGLDWSNISTLIADSSGSLYAGSFWAGLYKSTNNGTTWMKTSLLSGAQTAAVISGGRLCVGGADTVSVSTDGGETWSSSIVLTGPASPNVLSVAEDALGNIYATLGVVVHRWENSIWRRGLCIV